MQPNFADRDGLIWFDGELKPWRDCQTHVLTHTLHCGPRFEESVPIKHLRVAIFRLY